MYLGVSKADPQVHRIPIVKETDVSLSKKSPQARATIVAYCALGGILVLGFIQQRWSLVIVMCLAGIAGVVFTGVTKRRKDNRVTLETRPK